MALTNVSRSDAAKTDAALTSATPIISAAAVAEVRLGARPALSRASWPGAPYTLPTGQPIMRVTGLAMVDATLAVPRNISSAPPPASRISPGVPPGRANSPTRKSTAPMITVTVPATRRFELSAAKPSSGRIAATGGILAARRAGMMTAHIVMPTPTRNAISTERGFSTSEKSGKPAPAALKMPMISLATSIPPPMPMIVATTDMISASTMISRRTWRPLPPMARSSASSRRRWPIVMAKTLLMRNALTKAVMKAKINRPVPNGPMNELTALIASLLSVSRVTTSTLSGRACSSACCTVSMSAPSATRRSMVS